MLTFSFLFFFFFSFFFFLFQFSLKKKQKRREAWMREGQTRGESCDVYWWYDAWWSIHQVHDTWCNAHLCVFFLFQIFTEALWEELVKVKNIVMLDDLWSIMMITFYHIIIIIYKREEEKLGECKELCNLHAVYWW